jgi:predicted Rossmann fold nucleotide-binding protein DprA/Smf involved in DNA uptake
MPLRTAAHSRLVAAQSRFSGPGIDEVYPRDHKKLARRILDRGGAVVSQFPLGHAAGLGKLSVPKPHH